MAEAVHNASRVLVKESIKFPGVSVSIAGDPGRYWDRQTTQLRHLQADRISATRRNRQPGRRRPEPRATWCRSWPSTARTASNASAKPLADLLAGETLHGVTKRHDICRNLIRVWVQKYEAGAFDEDAAAAAA